MSTREPEAFEDRLQKALRAETEAPLAPEVAGRLAGIRRQAALTAGNADRMLRLPRRRWLLWGGMTTAAAGLLLAVAVSRQAPAPLPVFEEQAFAAAEDLELLEELEFLAWLEMEEEGGAG